MNTKAMHEKLEEIFNCALDHVHADMLHRAIDDQDTTIELLRQAVATQTARVETLEQIKSSLGRALDAYKSQARVVEFYDGPSYPLTDDSKRKPFEFLLQVLGYARTIVAAFLGFALVATVWISLDQLVSIIVQML